MLHDLSGPPVRIRDVGIAVMAKASAPGRTKTRLVPPLTFEEAAAFNTAFLRDVADNLLAAGRTGRIAGYMAYGPPGAGAFFDALMPAEITSFECWEAGFGACLRHALEEQFARRHLAACVLNADSPTLPAAFLEEAAEMLARPGDRAVLGPSADGGYYLLGLKQMHGRLFEDIAWSTGIVAEQTLARAQEIGLSVHLLPAWYDVDDATSLRTLLTEIESPALGSDRCRTTRALVAELRAADLLTRLDMGTHLPAAVSQPRVLAGATS